MSSSLSSDFSRQEKGGGSGGDTGRGIVIVMVEVMGGDEKWLRVVVLVAVMEVLVVTAVLWQ